ncbi:hypothetical protein Aca07nite_03870 [Actinoplanes capillaceus]|uniref:Uncharacterized protein n=1 Tax=Actinoplanes campanulatus TaxID=113559 RepID=A0ABQ3WAS8_9ACTN|nr:hypothetical protein [Actinoplanes capillaceus]GID43112.1 hypothetical protein Aca07nite_03870 [Actinoplanes capillaceus]
MEPLRDVFAGLAGPGSAPGDFLRELPEELVAEAVVSYADTAPVEVAEHLASFVSAHSAVGAETAGELGWLDLLTTAPVEAGTEIDETDLDFGTGADAVEVDQPDLFDVESPVADELPETGDEEPGEEIGLDLTVDWPEIDDLPDGLDDDADDIL